MTKHKFTDDEIVKALHCCKTPKCSNCAECPKRHLGTDCLGELICDTIALINRQKAEVAYWMDEAVNAKKEAVKAFAEKAKRRLPVI